MVIFGISEPIIIGCLLLGVSFFYYALPRLMKKKSLLDYSNFDIKNSNAFHHFGGVGGVGYHNLQLKESPTIHQDGKADLWLEGLTRPFFNVIINPLSGEKNYKIKETADCLFGTRIDIYWNIDGAGKIKQWDNMLIQNWELYTDRMQKSSKSKLMINQLAEKEFAEEMKGMIGENSPGAVGATNR